MKFVESLLAACPYRLTLRFNTGEVRVVDLEATLRAKGLAPQSAYGRLLDPATFSRARLDPEAQTVCWGGLAREIAPDGTELPAPLNFCPDFLYQLSAPFAQAVVEPAAGDAKLTEPHGLILKDEPQRSTAFRWSFGPRPPNDHRLPSANPRGWAAREGREGGAH